FTRVVPVELGAGKGFAVQAVHGGRLEAGELAPSPASGGRSGWGRALSARPGQRCGRWPHPGPSGPAQGAGRPGILHGMPCKQDAPTPARGGGSNAVGQGRWSIGTKVWSSGPV